MRQQLVNRFLSIHKMDYNFFKEICQRLSFNQLWQGVGDGLPIANTICHTVEMEQFWIDWGLCGNSFKRNREIEFTRSKDLTNEELIKRLDDRFVKTQKIIKNIPPEEWIRKIDFHDETFTGVGIIEWHLHHLGIHVGHIQIKEQCLGIKMY